MKSLLAVFLLLTAMPSVAQTKKMTVYFSCTCADGVGGRIATAFRDILARSPRYAEAYDEKNAIYELSVVSMDPTQNSNGSMGIYSVVLTAGSSLLLNHEVGQCGSSHVQECAERIMAFLDGQTH